MHKIVLWGYYGQGNFGDDLMLANICDYLSLNKNVQISIITADKSNTEVTENSNIKSIEAFRKNKFKNFKLFAETLKGKDYLVWGGGTCFSDEDGMPNLMVLLLAKILQVKVIFIGVGVSEIIKTTNKIKMKLNALLVDSICVRDEKSLDIAKNYFSKEKLSLTEDIAYMYNQSKNSIKSVGVMTVSLRNLDNYLSLEEQEKFITNVYLFLENILEKNIYRKINVLVLDTKIDIDTNKKLYKLLLNDYGTEIEVVFICDKSYKRKIEILEESNFNVVLRLHGAFISEINGIKTIGISYSEKVKRFMQSIHSDGFIDIDEVVKDKKALIGLYNKINESNNRKFDKADFKKKALKNFSFLKK